MIPYLFHIGPFYFHLYGFWIAVGILMFLLLAQRDRITRTFLKPGQLSGIIACGIILGIIGGRLLSIITDWQFYHSIYEIIAPWEPGYSLQGSIIALMIGIPVYVRIKHIPITPVLDITGLYAPLLQSIARIGCFCAGCCHGIPTTIAWAITYSHPESYAPRGIALHPTQLYSALSLFVLFIFMHTVARRFLHKPGQLFGVYLMGASTERFINDFWRADHIATLLHSPDRLLALCLFCVGLLVLVRASTANTKPYPDA